MGTPKQSTAECDRYVSCLCSVPRPDRYTEMKLLKELIDGENTPLLKTVIRRVAAITSGEERTPIFKKLAEKFGCYRSQEGANQIVESKEKCSPPKTKENVSNSPAPGDPIQDSKSGTFLSTDPETLVGSDNVLTLSDCSQEPIVSSDSGPLTSNLPLRVDSIVNQTDSINGLDKIEAFTKKKLVKEKIQSNDIQILDISPSSSKKDLEKFPLSPEEFVLKCEVCEKVFNNSISVDMHKRRSHKIVKGSYQYSRKRLQLKGTSVACEKCERKYDNKDQLDRHMKRAHNEKSTIPCPENCGKMFTSNEKAKRHLLSHKPQSEWPVSCPLCSKRFIERYDLSQHLLGTAHRHEIHAEVGSDQWWLLVYWDKPQDAPRNEVKAM